MQQTFAGEYLCVAVFPAAINGSQLRFSPVLYVLSSFRFHNLSHPEEDLLTFFLESNYIIGRHVLKEIV